MAAVCTAAATAATARLVADHRLHHQNIEPGTAKLPPPEGLGQSSGFGDRRQSLAMQESTGSKRGGTGSANQRTEQKARLLDEVLKRFEARLDKVTAAPAPAASKAPKERAAEKPVTKPKTPTKTRAPSPRTAHAAKGPTKVATRKGAAGPSAQVKAQSKVQVAHKRASTARSQAKRGKR